MLYILSDVRLRKGISIQVLAYCHYSIVKVPFVRGSDSTIETSLFQGKGTKNRWFPLMVPVASVRPAMASDPASKALTVLSCQSSTPHNLFLNSAVYFIELPKPCQGFDSIKLPVFFYLHRFAGLNLIFSFE